MLSNLRQHLLMARIAESFEDFLLRVARRVTARLVLEEPDASMLALEGDKHDLLAKMRMAARLRRALDEHIHDLVVYGEDRGAAMLTETLGGTDGDRPTWKEIGEALGVSGQAAHRKYGEAVRRARSVPVRPA
jgi:hypothetical protein